MRLRRTAVAALLAAGIALPAVTTAAVAYAQPGGKPVAAQKSDPRPAKTRKPVQVKFTASGTVTAVDAAAGTLTVQAKGGTKDVRRRTVTVTVPGTARIQINGVRASLSAVTAGARVTVTGTRAGTTYTATRVQAKKAVSPSPSPSPSVSPSPTVSPSPDDDGPSPGTSTEPDDDPSGDDSSGNLSD